jgi:protein phosphatase 1 regulatory subunit 7
MISVYSVVRNTQPRHRSKMPASDPPQERTPSHQPQVSSIKPLLDSNGWDGKLRHPSKQSNSSPTNSNRTATLTNPEALEDPDYSDPDAPPPDLLPADEDLLDDYPLDSTDIDLVHCRISSIPSLQLSRFSAVERLCLRQNAIYSIQFPEGFGKKLQDLDLYDNLIKHVDGLEGFADSLESLDLSFNKIKHIQGVDRLKELKDIYLVQNRIQKIENLEGLGRLRMLELAANRIRVSLIDLGARLGGGGTRADVL